MTLNKQSPLITNVSALVSVLVVASGLVIWAAQIHPAIKQNEANDVRIESTVANMAERFDMDHDVLVQLVTQIKELREDIQDLKQDVKAIKN